MRILFEHDKNCLFFVPNTVSSDVPNTVLVMDAWVSKDKHIITRLAHRENLIYVRWNRIKKNMRNGKEGKW